MAIDQELIEDTLGKLGKKLSDLKTDATEIQKLIHNLQLISNKEGKKPKDPLTEDEMSEERVKEIFNSVAKKAVKYIGGNK